MGFIVLIVISFIVFGGILAKYLLNYVNWKTKLTLNVKFIHAVRIIQFIKYTNRWLELYSSWSPKLQSCLVSLTMEMIMAVTTQNMASFI
jgi:hypothetical protein